MTRLLRRWPLMRATYQTYRNVGLEAYRDHREVVGESDEEDSRRHRQP